MRWPLGRGAAAASSDRPAEAPGASRVPPGVRVYAVGDIHGRADLLDELLAQIADDAARGGAAARPAYVFLGDYIDRGPDSRAVVERLRRFQAAGGGAVRCLMGNHEKALLDFVDDPATGATWAEYGGDATLRSYGVTPPRLRGEAGAWEAAHEAFVAVLPAAHLAWLRALPLRCGVGDYLFVHAGVRPGVAIAEQAERDLLWIREPFLSWTGPHERVVVHGHTPEPQAHLGPWRIGLDTGAYATGRLTALVLEGADRSLLQTGG